MKEGKKMLSTTEITLANVLDTHCILMHIQMAFNVQIEIRATRQS